MYIHIFFDTDTQREIDFESCGMKPNLESNYIFPIDFVSKGILFDVKSIGKV